MTLKKSEQLALQLRERYERCGYRPFKMSKFEEYDFYVRNKEALTHEGVITFTDTTGKLMALKPDVTLSILKQVGADGGARKVYYNENVYRVSPDENCYKEIPQMGLECMGEVDVVCIHEVLRLALDTLQAIGGETVLDLSHLGLIIELLTDVPVKTARRLCALLAQKNAHELRAECAAAKLDAELCDTLCALTALYGTPDEVLPQLETLLPHSPALQELKAVVTLLDDATLRIDPSAMDDMNYYNGFVFKGFVRGVPETVLSGGQYDKLMQQMGNLGGAIGYAVYLDCLERLEEDRAATDADILLLYDGDSDPAALQAAATALRQEGSVMLQKSMPREMRFGKVMRFVQGRVEEI